MDIKMVNDKPMNIRKKQHMKLHVYKKIEFKGCNGKTTSVESAIRTIPKKDIARSPTIRKSEIVGHIVHTAFNQPKAVKVGESISFDKNNHGFGGGITCDKHGGSNNNRKRTNCSGTNSFHTRSQTSGKNMDIQKRIYQLKEKKSINGVARYGGNAVLSQLEGGEEISQSLMIMESIVRPANQILQSRLTTMVGNGGRISKRNNYRQGIKDKTLKNRSSGIKKAVNIIGKRAKDSHAQDKGQTKKAVGNRIRSYVLDKMSTGETRDTLANTVKDIVKLKAALLAKGASKYLLAAFAPLLPGILMVAAPVVILIILLYCSPLV